MNNGLLAAGGHSVSPTVTILFGAILVGLIACLALEEKLHAKKSLIAGVFAIVCLLLGAVCGVLPFHQIVVGSTGQLVEHDDVHGRILDDKDGDVEEVHLAPVAPATNADAGDNNTGDSGQSEPEHAEPAQTPDHAHRPLHVDGHRLNMPVYIPGIDWGVIIIILGSSLFVDVTSKSGLFTWIAVKVTKASRGDPLMLLVSYGLMTVVFSAVLNNVTAMIIVGSLTVVSLEKLNRRDKLLGFLLIEGLLTNIGGLLTLISSVPNIIVGTAAGISFVEFFLKSSPYVAVATAVTLFMGAKLFGIQRLTSAEDREAANELVSAFDENDGVESWGFFRFSSIMLALFVITIATTSVLPLGIRHLGMGFVAMSFAGVMLIRFKSEVDRFYSAVDWDLLGFFMALFVVIYAMEHALVLDAIGAGVNRVLVDVQKTPSDWRDATTLLFGAAVFSSVTDNIPLAAMLANILKSLGASGESGLWWSVIFGANLGGNLTPIGSASTLVAVTIMHKHKLPMSFAGFVKAAFVFAVVQIVLASVYVLLFLR
ncbi:MAG: SLC13 family permease [Pirellulaceae bacterium]|jgi:Na+/H+ antiporter NhaD/arsenite permease-like protein|nr:SLC13 family permease [Pirellulaceae bacterium]MDP7018522.1 SLC13 family permease [Pirellulaceae bacterium]